MGKPTGFMDYKRTELALRAPEERIKDWQEIKMSSIRKHCADRQRAVWIAEFPFAIAV
mgnify:CR=1 FL=1